MTPKGEHFNIPKRVSREYESAIRKWVQRVLTPKLPEESYQHWAARVRWEGTREDAQFASQVLARQMVEWVDDLNVKDWRAASNKVQGSARLYRLLSSQLQGSLGVRFNQLIRENAQLIRSVPHKAAYILADEIAKAQQAGARPETVAAMARRRFPQLLQSRINLMARTETAKASAALTEARCEELDLQFYIWRTSEDQRVRTSHKKMDGVVVPWKQPPSPERLVGEKDQGHYHAGQTYNCRCTQIVVLTIEDIPFPARVYWQGSLQRMTKTRFQQLFNIETRQGAKAA